MPKILRFLLTLAAAAAVLYVLRDRLAPVPERPQPAPPPFRPAPPHRQEEEPAVDDLTEVKGIGPVYAARLTEMGIPSFAALALADPADLAAKLDISEAAASDWIRQAGELAR